MKKFLEGLMTTQVRDLLKALIVAAAGALVEYLVHVVDAIGSVPPV